MTKVLVRKMTSDDVEVVIKTIRKADATEIEAATGRPYPEVIRKILHTGDQKWTGLANGEVVCIFGMHVTSAISGTAVPWLISTYAVEKYPVSFLKYCRKILNKITVNIDSMANYVDDRNELAKLWLEWMGFKLGEPEPWGAKMVPFRPFIMEVKHV